MCQAMKEFGMYMLFLLLIVLAVAGAVLLIEKAL